MTPSHYLNKSWLSLTLFCVNHLRTISQHVFMNSIRNVCSEIILLTHWGRATHICVGKLTIIGSDNGLSPGRRPAIIWTNAGILLIRPWGTNFSEIFNGNQIFSFKKMHLKMSSAKWRPVYLGLNVLNCFHISLGPMSQSSVWLSKEGGGYEWIWIYIYMHSVWKPPEYEYIRWWGAVWGNYHTYTYIHTYL